MATVDNMQADRDWKGLHEMAIERFRRFLLCPLSSALGTLVLAFVFCVAGTTNAGPAAKAE